MNTSLKKVIWTILCGVVILATISALVELRNGKNMQQEVKDTRRALREQGFKTDLADFKLTTDAAAQAREADLNVFRAPLPFDANNPPQVLLPQTTDDSCRVLWRSSTLDNGTNSLSWAEVHGMLDGNQAPLDNACAVVLSGPVRFNFTRNADGDYELRHSIVLRYLALAFRARELLDLHDGHADSAWTNLLAATRLLSAWDIDPFPTSHLFRYTLADFAFADTWQALQKHDWPDARLAALQQEWESVNYFTNLPETIAVRRAFMSAHIEHERQLPSVGGSMLVKSVTDAFEDPAKARQLIGGGFHELGYHGEGSLAEEKNLLLYCRDREAEARAAIASPTWLQMRALPGVTNPPVFLSAYPSHLWWGTRMEQINDFFWRSQQELFYHNADAEARRRVIVTAIALERYRGKHGAYPPALDLLAPEFLQTVPVDFMDGQPLRYRLTDDGYFVLYSIGLNGMDDGGKLPPPDPSSVARPGAWSAGAAPGADILWPRPDTSRTPTNGP